MHVVVTPCRLPKSIRGWRCSGPRSRARASIGASRWQSVDANESRADYVVMAEPCRTVFDAQPAPKAVFTASAGVAHLFRLHNLPVGVPLVRIEDAGMAQPMSRYVLARGAALCPALRPLRANAAGGALGTAARVRAGARCARECSGWASSGPRWRGHWTAQGFAVRGFAQSHKEIAGVVCYAGGASL
jgi:glyoxylate/hydroxypyruvate reductase A